MNPARRTLALVLCFAALTWADGNTFDKVRYNGGSVPSKVDPKDWGNKLTVAPDAITLALKDGQKVEIPPKSVTGLSYGQEAHRRVGTMIALAVLVSPVALFGLLHKTRLHFIGIQYTTPDSKNGGILLQGDKDNYRAILVALQGVTGKSVSVAEKDREFVPLGVKSEATKGAEEQTVANNTAEPRTTTGSQSVSESANSSNAELAITSTPPGADIEIDGSFVGNTPSNISIATGDHTITIKKVGFKSWERKMKVSGGKVNIAAELEAAPL